MRDDGVTAPGGILDNRPKQFWGPERVRHRHKFYAVGLRNDGTDVDLEFVGGYPYVNDTGGTLFKRTMREDDRGRRIYEEA